MATRNPLPSNGNGNVGEENAYAADEFEVEVREENDDGDDDDDDALEENVPMAAAHPTTQQLHPPAALNPAASGRSSNRASVDSYSSELFEDAAAATVPAAATTSAGTLAVNRRASTDSYSNEAFESAEAAVTLSATPAVAASVPPRRPARPPSATRMRPSSSSSSTPRVAPRALEPSQSSQDVRPSAPPIAASIASDAAAAAGRRQRTAAIPPRIVHANDDAPVDYDGTAGSRPGSAAVAASVAASHSAAAPAQPQSPAKGSKTPKATSSKKKMPVSKSSAVQHEPEFVIEAADGYEEVADDDEQEQWSSEQHDPVVAAAGSRAVPSAKKSAPAPSPPRRTAASKPPSASVSPGGAAAPASSSSSDPRKGADYDRQRREQMKAQRARAEAAAARRAEAETEAQAQAAASYGQQYHPQMQQQHYHQPQQQQPESYFVSEPSAPTPRRGATGQYQLHPHVDLEPPVWRWQNYDEQQQQEREQAEQQRQQQQLMEQQEQHQQQQQEQMYQHQQAIQQQQQQQLHSFDEQQQQYFDPQQPAQYQQQSFEYEQQQQFQYTQRHHPHPPPPPPQHSHASMHAHYSVAEAEEKTQQFFADYAMAPAPPQHEHDGSGGVATTRPGTAAAGGSYVPLRFPRPPSAASTVAARAPTRPSTGAAAPRPSTSAGRPRSRAANAQARAKVLANLALGRPPSAPMTAYYAYATGGATGLGVAPTSTLTLQQKNHHPGSAHHLSRTDAWAAVAERKAGAQSAELASRASAILSALASSTLLPSSSAPFVPLPPPINATLHADVPRCFPRPSVTHSRVGKARFKRAKELRTFLDRPELERQAQEQKAAAAAEEGKAVDDIDGVAAADHDDDDDGPTTSRLIRSAQWDVASELSRGHALVGGLKARTALLASKLDGVGAVPAAVGPTGTAAGAAGARPLVASQLAKASLRPPSDPRGFGSRAPTASATQTSSDLFHTLSVTSSLENYYSLAAQLDEGLQRRAKQQALLGQVLLQPNVAATPAPVPVVPPPRSNANGPAAGANKRNQSRPSSAMSHVPLSHSTSAIAGSSSTAQLVAQLAPAENPAWLHGAGPAPPSVTLPTPTFVRPSSASRAHPQAPPTLIPAYDSLTDPHVARTLASRSRVHSIARNRGPELDQRPDLRSILIERHVAGAVEQAQDDAWKEAERWRKLKLDRPPAERISHRPATASATATLSDYDAPEASADPSFTFLRRSTTGAPVGIGGARRSGPRGNATRTFRLANSAYGSGVRPKNKEAWRRAHPADLLLQAQRERERQPSATSTRRIPQQQQQQRPHSQGQFEQQQQQYAGDEYGEGPYGSDAEYGEGDAVAAATTGAPAFGMVDWFDVSSSNWPREPSQLTRDLVALGIIEPVASDEDDAHDAVEEKEDAEEDEEDSLLAADAAGEELDEPSRMLARFRRLERCLLALHTQLGLPFEPSSTSSSGGSFSLEFPPTVGVLHALTQAVRALIECRDLVVAIVAAIAERERIVAALNDAANRARNATAAAAAADEDDGAIAAPLSPPTSLLSQLAASDRMLLALLDSYSALFGATFPHRAEFAAAEHDETTAQQQDCNDPNAQSLLPFRFRGEDYALRILREQQQLRDFFDAQHHEQQRQQHHHQQQHHQQDQAHAYAAPISPSAAATTAGSAPAPPVALPKPTRPASAALLAGAAAARVLEALTLQAGAVRRRLLAEPH